LRKKKCDSCEQISDADLEELLKNKVQPTDCPFRQTCTTKVLKEEAEYFCKDQEITRTSVLYHVYGKHTWETCEVYRQKKREEEGKLPREW